MQRESSEDEAARERDDDDDLGRNRDRERSPVRGTGNERQNHNEITEKAGFGNGLRCRNS